MKIYMSFISIILTCSALYFPITHHLDLKKETKWKTKCFLDKTLLENYGSYEAQITCHEMYKRGVRR